MSNQGHEQFEFQRPLIPVTPFRPIPPKPSVIQPEKQENQISQANYFGSERRSSGFTQESQPDGVVSCSNFTGYTGINGGVSNGQRQCPLNLVDYTNVAFTDLLALANAASQGINGRHQVECSSAGLLPVHVNLTAQQDTRIDGNCTPRKHQSKSMFNLNDSFK